MRGLALFLTSAFTSKTSGPPLPVWYNTASRSMSRTSHERTRPIANATNREGIWIELPEPGPESLQRKAVNSWKSERQETHTELASSCPAGV
jgi:hypothetical protein